jgi:GntR family transcriptional regulator, rspAB operon transcriptional repressor
MTARPRPTPAATATGLRGDDESAGVADVHDRVREAILRGDLAADTTVSQVALANDLGISRTPLREALRMLQREGLVSSERNRQVRIAPLSVDDVEQIYCARLSLEATAARLTVMRLTPEQAAEIEGNLARLVHFAVAHDYERWELVHREFHGRLVAEAGPRFAELLRQLSDHAERYRRLYTINAPRAWSTGSDEHRLIADAAIARDADLLARRLAAHLAHTAFGVIELLDGDHRPERLQATVAQLVGPDDPWAR